MSNAHTSAFTADLQTFAQAVTTQFAQQVHAQPEDQLKGPVAALLKGAGSRSTRP